MKNWVNNLRVSARSDQINCCAIRACLLRNPDTYSPLEFNRELQQEFTSKIEQLLAEKPGQNVAASTATPCKPGN